MPSEGMETRAGALVAAGACFARPPLLRPVLIAGAASDVSATSAHFVSVQPRVARRMRSR